jgi:hypothetical protein
VFLALQAVHLQIQGHIGAALKGREGAGGQAKEGTYTRLEQTHAHTIPSLAALSLGLKLTLSPKTSPLSYHLLYPAQPFPTLGMDTQLPIHTPCNHRSLTSTRTRTPQSALRTPFEGPNE